MDQVRINGRFQPGQSGCPQGPAVARMRRIRAKIEALATEFGGVDALPVGDRDSIAEAAALLLSAPKKRAEDRVRYVRLARQLVNDVRERVIERQKEHQPMAALEGLRPVDASTE